MSFLFMLKEVKDETYETLNAEKVFLCIIGQINLHPENRCFVDQAQVTISTSGNEPGREIERKESI